MNNAAPLRTYPARPAERDLRRSWFAVAALPVGLVLAMVIGEGLISLIGYDSTARAVPVWAVLTASLPALLILVAPGLVAVFYGRRAYRAGLSAARWPAWIGGGVAALMFTLNLLAFVVGR